MILIADSGSTKTEWKIIKDGVPGKSVFSSGINPYFLSEEEIYEVLKRELTDISGNDFKEIYYYGTGCNSESANNKVRQAINRFFSSADIYIGSDLLGAARSLCLNDPGIACIMGTGSNSCYYNGEVIVSNVAPLGYILGDEGGGAVIGRKLVSGILKKQVPQTIVDIFFDTYKLTPTEILENVYMKPFPNRFLGQFSMFISAHIEIPELQDIINSSFDDFIRRNVMQYPEAKSLPVNFTGSIAFHFRTFLEDLLRKNDLNIGIITLTPMDNLVKFHLLKE
jgi:glucosamine kinase